MTATSAAPVYLGDRSFVPHETYEAFLVLIGRLEKLIEGETDMLRAHQHQGIAEVTRQKRQGLLELNRLMRSLDNTIPSQDIIARLATFRRKLDANDAALQVELRAAQAVTETIVRVMREMESDGTYSRAYGRYDDFE